MKRLPKKYKTVKTVVSAIVALAIVVIVGLGIVGKALSVNNSELEIEVFELINRGRIAHGLQPLEWDEKIAEVARLHSRDMVENNFFSHQNLRGENPGDRLRRKGINYPAGEVLHQQSRFSFIIPPIPKTQGHIAGDTVNGWMNSPGHRMIILGGSFSKIGVGVWDKDFSTNYYFTALLV